MKHILGLFTHFVKARRLTGCRFAVLAALLQGCAVASANGLYERALDAVATGDTTAAASLLEQLVQQQPNHAGAWLDMAMLYCSAGYSTQALSLFDAIENRFAPPTGILELIAAQRASGCKASAGAANEPSRTSWGAQLARGFESNVNQGVRDLDVTLNSTARSIRLQLTPDYAPRSDAYSALTLDASRPMGQAGTQAWVQWHARVFDTQHAFDVKSIAAGVVQPWLAQPWKGRLQASASQVDLGNSPYQQSVDLRLSATPQAGLPAGWQADLSLGWSDIRYLSVAGFNARWLDLRSALSYSAARWALQGSVGWQRDQALGLRPGGDRYGWSAELGGRWALGSGGMAELAGGVQNWVDNAAYSPGLIDQQRTLRSANVRAAVLWRAGPQGHWVFEVRHVRNLENIGLFGYDAASVQLGYQWRFGKREP